jgi:hypothetical protein
MVANHFDTVLRSLSQTPSRRNTLRLLGGSALGGLLMLGMGRTEAKKSGRGKGQNKKGKKVTLCHNGQTIIVSRSAGKGHKKHGDTVGPCQVAPSESLQTYQCSGPKNSLVSFNGDVRFAQTFTAERSGSLRQIQFNVDKKPGTTGDYVVQLLRVIAGKPSHSPVDVLATVTIPNAAVTVGSEATVTASFAGPALLAGTEYAAAFSRPGAALGEATVNTINVGGSSCGGKLFLAVGGDVFAPEIFAQDALVSVLVQ